MSTVEPPQGYEPVPGESRLALVTTAVLLGIAFVILIGVLIASPSNAAWPAVFVAIAAAGFAFTLLQRRSFLRDRRNGVPLVRRPWRGENLGPPG